MVIVAGAGPGNPEYLTAEVRQAISQTPKVLALHKYGKTLTLFRASMKSSRQFKNRHHKIFWFLFQATHAFSASSTFLNAKA